MASFYVWETKDFPIHLTTQDESNTGILEDLKDVIISFGQGKKLVEKDMASPDVALDPENDIINVHLSQEETGTFKENQDVTVQVNFYYTSAERDTSAQTTIKALPNLHKEVMS